MTNAELILGLVDDIMLKVKFRFAYQNDKSLPKYFASLKASKNSEFHEFFHVRKIFLVDHNPKMYSRLCLRYVLIHLQLKF